MTNFLPIFPLGIVAYPTEVVNLHIFEPRYKQLIHECFTQSKMFGMPIVIDGIVQEIGTVMKVIAIEKEYTTGEMDIRCLGLHTFNVLEIVQQVPDKLYSGAIVTHLDPPIFGAEVQQKAVILSLRKLHNLLKVEKNYKKPNDDLTSFDIAHHIGFDLQNEYNLLCLHTEVQRFTYIAKQLKQGIEHLDEQQKTIARIQLNGHFRNLSLDDFDFKK